MLDEYGHYMTYGEAVNSARCGANGTCPRGWSRAASSSATSPKDDVITYDDVELPPDRLADALRAEQYAHFPAVV